MGFFRFSRDLKIENDGANIRFYNVRTKQYCNILNTAAIPEGALSDYQKKPIYVNNVVLDQEGWTLNEGLYEYDYENEAITANTNVTISVTVASYDVAATAQLMTECTEGAGSVKLYAKNAPAGDIVVNIEIKEV